MRILQIARQFHPRIGGVESCVLNLGRILRDKGHDVEVLTIDRNLHTGESLPREDVVDGLPTHRIPAYGSPRYPIAPLAMRFPEAFDVLHIHAIDFFVDFLGLCKSLRLHRKPIVVSTHGGIFHTNAWLQLKRVYWHSILRTSLRSVHRVVCVSEADRALFSSIVPPEKLVLIHNGVDIGFQRAHGIRQRGLMVYFGRVTPAKRIDNILRLFASVARLFPDAELIVIGPDQQGAEESLRVLTRELGLDSRVRFLGAVSQAELVGTLARAHLYISAAPYEGFGIATIEALTSGVPVFVTPTGVHSQAVQRGVNGWLWNGIPDEAAARVLRTALGASDSDLDQMRQHARASAAPFQWRASAEEYERVLEHAYRESVSDQ